MNNNSWNFATTPQIKTDGSVATTFPFKHVGNTHRTTQPPIIEEIPMCEWILKQKNDPSNPITPLTRPKSFQTPFQPEDKMELCSCDEIERTTDEDRMEEVD